MWYQQEKFQELLVKLEGELKASPENILRFNHLAKLANVGQLALSTSHTFNNILGGILGYSQLLKIELQKNEEGLRQAATIESAARRASKLVTQLQLHSSNSKPSLSVVDPQLIVDEIALLIQSTFPKNIKIISKCDHEKARVTIDFASICQALLNICLNAKEAMPTGGTLKIETRLTSELTDKNEEEIDYVIFKISDTGGGIPEELLTRIFKPFFSTKEDTMASGLGLTIAEGVVREHGGEIAVRPGEKKGTIFEIQLPYKQASYIPENKHIPRPAENKEQVIMVVDDEEDLRYMAKMILEKKGFSVLLAESGENAIELFKEKHDSIDLVILDMIMPGIDGAKVYHALRNISSSSKLILTSGYVHNAPFQDIVESGDVTFIPKPWDLPEFLKEAEKTLSSN